MLEGLPAFAQRSLPVILAIELQQVESHEHRRRGHIALWPPPEPLEATDELAIKHGHLGIEDHGVSAQPRDGLRQLREALGERLALAADELGRPTLLLGHHPVPVHLLFVDPASRWKGVEISVGCMSNRVGSSAIPSNVPAGPGPLNK
jgi:hypothetical protein